MATKRMPIGLFVSELEAAYKRGDGYIMCATGQNPKKWATNSWWFTQYSGSQKTKALYWREHAARVWDCNGLAEGLYKDWSGVDINTKARYNYASWCTTKGTGMIPAKYRVAGAAVFWGNKASTITHVAYLYKPVDPKKPSEDWYIIEARGVMHGVVKTKLSSRKPNFWGLMEKYFDYGNTSTGTTGNTITTNAALGSRLLEKGCKGEDVKLLQQYLMKLGYDLSKYKDDGDFGGETEDAVKKFQENHKLEVDGQYGKKSHAAMMTAIEKLTVRMVTITGDSVNIRKGAGTSYGILKVAHKGDKFERNGAESNGWIPIKINGTGYWVSAKYAK